MNYNNESLGDETSVDWIGGKIGLEFIGEVIDSKSSKEITPLGVRIKVQLPAMANDTTYLTPHCANLEELKYHVDMLQLELGQLCAAARGIFREEALNNLHAYIVYDDDDKPVKHSDNSPATSPREEERQR